MKILQINSVCGVGSTGKIAVDLYNVIKQNGHECKIAYGRGEAKGLPYEDTIKIGSKFGVYLHALLSRLTDRTGFFSTFATKKFIKKIKEYNPDVIHMHNIHGYYLNIKILFDYFKKSGKPIVWTLHDCWSFTGHCAYFEYSGCQRWLEGCKKCQQISQYPLSYIDGSRKNYIKKKEIFMSVDSNNVSIVTPCNWLADLVKKSYLSNCKVYTIYNGIDLNVFKPTESDFRNKYGLNNKKIILGVANIWEERKGLLNLIELSKKLDDNYQIVIVGKIGNDILPDNIIHIEKTENQIELAKIYSAADVFVNPTFEDNFPTVNVEALACGTPVITYDTGGSGEAADENSGMKIEKSVEELKKAIAKIENYTTENCLKRAAYFDKTERFKEYVTIYEEYRNR